MRPIATDGIAWSVCRSVALSRPWVIQKLLNWSRCRPGWTRGLDVLGGDPYAHPNGQFWLQKEAGPGNAQTCLPVDILKAGQQGAAPVWCRCWLVCTRWGAHWRHLANTSELSLCVGDVKLLWPLVGLWPSDHYFCSVCWFVMVALCNRADHYIFALWFLSSIFYLLFFPRLISAVGDWMSTILLHMAWP